MIRSRGELQRELNRTNTFQVPVNNFMPMQVFQTPDDALQLKIITINEHKALYTPSELHELVLTSSNRLMGA